MGKKYNIKVYSPDGTFLKNVPETLLKSRISFSSVLDGGQGELNIELALDPFDMPSWIDIFNFVRVYQFDENNMDGRLIYTGAISQRVPFANEVTEGINIVCLGLYSFLNNVFYKLSATNWTRTVVATDPGNIVKDIIDRFNIYFPPSSGTEWIGYDAVSGIRTGGQIDLAGFTADRVYDNRKSIEAIQETVPLTGGDWNWFIDKGGDVIFREKPSSATHTFTFKKDIQSLSLPESIEEAVNRQNTEYSQSGGGVEQSEDATSVSAYGPRERFEDTDTDSPNAQRIGDSFVEANKDPKKNGTLVINSEYDIETINPGDTCKIQNLPFGSTVAGDNMKIVSVSYNQETATIELETRQGLGVETDRLIAARK